MKSHVFKANETNELSVLLSVSVIVAMIFMVFTGIKSNTDDGNTKINQKYENLNPSSPAGQDVLPQFPVYTPVEKGSSEIPFSPAEKNGKASKENSSVESKAVGNDAVERNIDAQKLREYLIPEKEEPLQLENWMFDEKIWNSGASRR